jgi:pimeloyl-ACP methyl ester carboxylesterase
VHKLVSYRFGERGWTPAQAAAIGGYLYHISALPASGEYSLRSILIPLIRLKHKPQPETETAEGRPAPPPETIIRPFARVPLSPLLLSSGALPTNTSTSTSTNKEEDEGDTSPVPVLLLYGDSDWIKFPEVQRYTHRLSELGVPADLVIVPGAGHHLYMDNTEGVHGSIERWWGGHTRRQTK